MNRKHNYILIIPFAICVLYGLKGFCQVDSLTHDVTTKIFLEDPDKGKSDVKKNPSFNAYPYVFYTPETQFAAGAGGIYIFYGGKSKDLKPSKIGFGGFYSSNKQYKLSVSPTLYFFDNRLYVEAPTSFGFFINKFWGVGENAPDSDTASYSMESFTSRVTVQVPPRLFSADRTGLIFEYDKTDIVDKMTNDLIQNDSLVGSNGGKTVGLGTDLLWDSRDNIFFPNSGSYQYFKVVVYPNGWGDFNYSQIQLDVKAFKSFKPDHVFAFNFYIESVIGDTPFYKLPALGGLSRMRGFFNGRYRDNFYGMMQLEYRQYVYKKFGMVAFGGLGNVSENILKYSVDTMKFSGGIGLRYLFNEKEKINLRMDIGFNSDGTKGIYFGIQEAF